MTDFVSVSQYGNNIQNAINSGVLKASLINPTQLKTILDNYIAEIGI